MACASTSGGKVYWNDQLVASLNPPKDGFLVYHSVHFVKLNVGINKIKFEGAALSDGYGISIDNVKVTAPWSCFNLVENGDF